MQVRPIREYEFVFVSVSFKVRLAGNVNDSNSGWVEVSLESLDSWGMMCDSTLDTAVATVVCRSLNFTWGKVSRAEYSEL